MYNKKKKKIEKEGNELKEGLEFPSFIQIKWKNRGQYLTGLF